MSGTGVPYESVAEVASRLAAENAILEGRLAALVRERDNLRDALRLYNAAADKFIEKVDTGRAHSVTTYRELKAARAAAVTAEPPADVRTHPKPTPEQAAAIVRRVEEKLGIAVPAEPPAEGAALVVDETCPQCGGRGTEDIHSGPPYEACLGCRGSGYASAATMRERMRAAEPPAEEGQ